MSELITAINDGLAGSCGCTSLSSDNGTVGTEFHWYKNGWVLGTAVYTGGFMKIHCTPRFRGELSDPDLIEKLSAYMSHWKPVVIDGDGFGKRLRWFGG